MELKVMYFFLLISCSQIECLRIGFIRNVSLKGDKGLQKNGLSCDECACLLSKNFTFISFNCYLSNASCEFFSSYNFTIDYQIKDTFNNIFYFIQLPPIFQISTVINTNTTRIQNADTTLQITTIAKTTTTSTSSITTTSSTTTTTSSTTIITSTTTTSSTTKTTSTTTTSSTTITTSTTTTSSTTITTSTTTTSSATTTTSSTTIITSTTTTSSTTKTTSTTTTSSTTITTSTTTTSSTTITTSTTTTPTVDPCPYTAAGRCNSTVGIDSFSLNQPIDVFINRNGTILYVGEYGNNRVQAFQLPSKSGTTVSASVSGVLGIYRNDDTSIMYVTEYWPRKLSKWPSGQTVPPSGTSTACNASGGWFSMPYAVVGDRQGTIYVSHNTCHTVVKWASNATQPVLIGGTGSNGSSSQHLSSPRHMYLDEDNDFLYIADTNNHRIQRFSTKGNGTGVTVAGGHGAGAASNQLKSPTGVYVSKKNGSIYISDQNNHRIQKWSVNSTSGVTVAGNSNGTSGKGPFALDLPFAVVLDPDETYMYVADYNNNRVQRYPVV